MAADTCHGHLDAVRAHPDDGSALVAADAKRRPRKALDAAAS